MYAGCMTFLQPAEDTDLALRQGLLRAKGSTSAAITGQETVNPSDTPARWQAGS
jgi:hypothetical protein